MIVIHPNINTQEEKAGKGLEGGECLMESKQTEKQGCGENENTDPKVLSWLFDLSTSEFLRAFPRMGLHLCLLDGGSFIRGRM